MTMMKCGHNSSGAVRHSDNKPVCLACLGIVDGADEPMEIDLTGRMAVCTYCDNTNKSAGGPGSGWRGTLPFLQYRPNEERDKYYCGCRGWN